MDDIQELVEKINSGQFPKDFSHFGGANDAKLLGLKDIQI